MPNIDLSRVLLLKFGKHASSTDVSADAVTQYFLEPQTDPELTTDVEKLDRDLVRGDNENYASIVGKKMTAINFNMEVRGIQQAGGTGGAGDSQSAAYTTNTQLGSLLDCVCGVNGNNDSGETTDAADAGTGTTVTMDAATSLSNQNGVLVKGTTSGKYQAREVVSTSGDDVTICRELTTDTGAADTAAESEVAFASASWYLDADNANHIHAFFDAEGYAWRRKLYGCLGNCTFNVENGAVMTANFTMGGTDWLDVAEANPTFTAQRAGTPAVAIDSAFHIGSTRYDLLETSIDLGLTMQDKTTFDGTNGMAGFAVTRAQPVITAKLYYSDTLLNTLQGATTQDVLLQIGSTAGSTIAFRMPAGSTRNAKRSITNGMETIDVEFVGSRPTSGNGSLRIHLF